MEYVSFLLFLFCVEICFVQEVVNRLEMSNRNDCFRLAINSLEFVSEHMSLVTNVLVIVCIIVGSKLRDQKSEH